MASPNMTVAETSSARSLAHKLYSQCRDTPGAYKALQSDVRRMRNVLEELEEALGEDTINDIRRVKVLPTVANAKHVLAKLDLAVQSYRCSKDQHIDEGIVAAFKSNLDSITDDLTTAFDTLTGSGQIPVRFDPRPSSESTRAEPTSAVSSSGMSFRQERPTSMVSSAGSGARHDVHSQSSRTDLSSVQTPIDISKPSDEKEIYPSVVIRSSSPYTNSLQSPGSARPRNRSTSSAFSPFAIPDPMSTDFDTASCMILGSDETVEQGLVQTSNSSLMSSPAHDSDNASGSFTSANEVPLTDGFEVGEVIRNEGALPDDSTAPSASDHRGDATANVTLRSVIVESTEEENEAAGQNRQLNRHESAATVIHISHPVQSTSGSSVPEVLKVDKTGCKAGHDKVTESAPEVESKQSKPCSTDEPKSKYDSAAALASDTAGVPSSLATSKIASSQDDLFNKNDDNNIPLSILIARQRNSRYEKKKDTSSISSQQSEKGHASFKTTNKVSEEVDCQAGKDISGHEKGQDSARAGEQIDPMSLSPASTSPQDRETAPQPSTKTVLKEHDTEVDDPPESPPMPSRRPPPPPSPANFWEPRQLNPPNSRYTIVNASPRPSLARSDSNASDDLYNSSKPSSPVWKPSNMDGPPKIEIHLDDTPLIAPELSSSERTLSEPVENATSGDLSEEKKPPLPPRPRRDKRHVSMSIQNSSGSRSLQGGLTLSHATTEDQANRTRSKSFDCNGSDRPRYEEGIIQTNKILETVSPHPRSAGDSPKLDRATSNHAPERSNSSVAPERSNSRDAPQARRMPGHRTVARDFYGPESAANSDNSLFIDQARIDTICVYWNQKKWKEAESYLVGHLESMIEQNQVDAMKRTRHLLGVCASFRGRWSEALTYFLSVFNAPIIDVALLDAGDCAAAYWLGDTYALMNRREEALLAYCIAERNPWFQEAAQANFRGCLAMEQESVQLGVSKSDFKLHWSREQVESRYDSIIDTRIISKSAAKLCLETQPREEWGPQAQYVLMGPKRSRARVLYDLRNPYARPPPYYRMKICPESFESWAPWPMRYDPMFVMSNVHKGRLLMYECDLLEVFRTNSQAKVPKTGPLNLSRLDCFVHPDAVWIIKTLRECLVTLGIQWSEVINVGGTWFCCRHTYMQDGMAVVHYFSISIFQHSLRSGYRVAVCPDGIRASRLANGEHETLNDATAIETKHHKKLIRGFLEDAAHASSYQPNRRRSDAAQPERIPTSHELPRGASMNSRPPPIPPRPVPAT